MQEQELTLDELSQQAAVELPARELMSHRRRRRGSLINVGDVTVVVRDVL